MKYRKKPIIVEAFQWTGGPDQADDPEWFAEQIREGNVAFYGRDARIIMYIRTPRRPLVASVGDYIIRGVKGDIYPCRPDTFEATYEPVVERDEATYFDRTEGQM